MVPINFDDGQPRPGPALAHPTFKLCKMASPGPNLAMFARWPRPGNVARLAQPILLTGHSCILCKLLRILAGPGPGMSTVTTFVRLADAGPAPAILQRLQEWLGQDRGHLAKLARLDGPGPRLAMLQRLPDWLGNGRGILQSLQDWTGQDRAHLATLVRWHPALVQQILHTLHDGQPPALAQPIWQTLQDDPGPGPANLAHCATRSWPSQSCNCCKMASALTQPISQPVDDGQPRPWPGQSCSLANFAIHPCHGPTNLAHVARWPRPWPSQFGKLCEMASPGPGPGNLANRCTASPGPGPAILAHLQYGPGLLSIQSG
jgi:hypothetical protein